MTRPLLPPCLGMSWPVAGDPTCNHLLTPQASSLLVHLAVPSTPGIGSITETPLLVQDLPLLPQRFPQRPPGHPHPASAAAPATGPTPPNCTSCIAPGTKCILGKAQPCSAVDPGGLRAPKERGAGCRLGGPVLRCPGRRSCSFVFSFYLFYLCLWNSDKSFECLFTEKTHRSQGMTFSSNIFKE